MQSPAASGCRYTLLIGACLLVGCAREVQVSPPAHGTVVASGLNAPQGVYVDTSGSLWITDSGTGGTDVIATLPGPGGNVPVTLGNTARLLRVRPGQPPTTVAALPSLGTPFGNIGGAHLTGLAGTIYFTSGQWSLLPPGPTPAPQRPANVAAVVRVNGGTPEEVANLYAWEAAHNPDGVAPQEGGIDSHPYGIAALGGQLYVTDAAANDLLRLDPATKTLATVAVFEALRVTPPGETAAIEAQAVPTGVTAGPDGALYVSLLPGGPELPGSARIVRVDPASGAQSVYASGLSQLTDLQTGPDGQLYAVSLAPAGPGSGSVIRIRAGGVPEKVLGGLNFPTALAFNNRGDAFIALLGGEEPGSGKVVRYDYLTGFTGE